MQSQTAKRYSGFRRPNLRFFVDVRAAFHAGVGVGAFSVFNVEINPKAIGANFEFEVVAGISGIRLKKDFDDVAIP